MVTKQTKHLIWMDLLDSERHVRYFESLADWYSRRHKWLRFLILMSALTEAAVAIFVISLDLSGVWSIVGFSAILLIGIFIAVLVALESTRDYAEQAALLGWLSLDCKAFNVHWTELWHDVYTDVIEEPEARSRRRDIADRFNAITGRVDVPLDEKLNESCATAADKVLKERYDYKREG